MADYGMMRPMELHRVIARERVRKGWTQLELSRQAKVSARTVSRIENGWYARNDAVPSFRTVVRIGDALGVDLEELVDSVA